MDGTLGSQTALAARRHAACRSRAARSSREIVRARRRGGLPRRRARDRRPREPRGARRVRGDAGRLAAARAPPPRSSTRSCSRRRTSPASPSSGSPCSVQFSHAPSDRDLADRFWAGKTDGAYAFRSLLDVGRACRERLRRADRGARPARRASAPASGGRSTTAQPGIRSRRSRVEQAFHATCVAPAWLSGDERRRGTLVPGHAADLVVLDRDPSATTSTRRSSRRWSPAAGCTTRRPGEPARGSVRTPEVGAVRSLHGGQRIGRDQVVWAFGPDIQPVLEVEPGEVVTLETNDCFTGQIRSEADLVTEIDIERVNSARGPDRRARRRARRLAGRRAARGAP